MMKLNYNYIAENQFGEVRWIKKHPRKELIEHCGIKHVNKMYVDDNEGVSHHVGYVIGSNWWTVFKLSNAFES
jgi:hypothetical protein